MRRTLVLGIALAFSVAAGFGLSEPVSAQSGGRSKQVRRGSQPRPFKIRTDTDIAASPRIDFNAGTQVKKLRQPPHPRPGRSPSVNWFGFGREIGKALQQPPRNQNWAPYPSSSPGRVNQPRTIYQPRTAFSELSTPAPPPLPPAISLPPREVPRNLMFETASTQEEAGNQPNSLSLTGDPYDNPFLTQEDDNDPDTPVGGSLERDKPLPDAVYPEPPEGAGSDQQSDVGRVDKTPQSSKDPSSKSEEDTDDGQSIRDRINEAEKKASSSQKTEGAAGASDPGTNASLGDKTGEL